ncbi:histidine kinase N-terminal 7TM domain-containing protein [Halosimplex amylolyticum]|uniref:histidine kinase N-terminal 7TM domain-containing protein n=1 Tax=Halosimplex amylolyticum TaxID=3396616 RepID=UPI003F575780
MATPLLTPIVLLGAIVGSGVAAFVWAFRDTPGAKSLGVFMIAASVLALAQGLSLATPPLASKIFWSNVAATVSPALPLAWLATVLAYAESDRAVRGRTLAVLLVEPVVFVALVWTNADHALVWTDRWIETPGSASVLVAEFGLAMWAHVGYSYLLIALGGLELVRVTVRTSGYFRSQGTALLASVFVPVGIVALSMYGVVPEQYDLIGLGFVFAGLVMTAALFRGRLLSITPAMRQLGREAVIDEMDDRIVILDGDDRIIDVNPAAARLFDVDPDDVVGAKLERIGAKLADAIGSLEGGQAELTLDGPDGRRYYDVRVSPLYRSYGGVAGRVVSVRDVTGRRQHEQRLDVLNRVLRHNLRNELNVVRGNAELLRRDVEPADPDVERRLDRIEGTVDTVSARSEKIGQVSRALDRDCDDGFDAAVRLASLAESVEERYPGATVRVQIPDDLTVVGGPSLERAFEELLENAAEHGGDAPTVEVTAERTGDGFTAVRIEDDGPGIDRQERVVIEEGRETALEHGSGVGLWLVNWIVQECRGDIEFAATDEGTAVVVTLPVATADGGLGGEADAGDAHAGDSHADDPDERAGLEADD